MEKYFMVSILLIPAPQFADKDLHWIDTFTTKNNKGKLEKVHIIAFNVASKKEIVPLLTNKLTRLQQLENPTEIDAHNAKFIEKTLWEIESGTYEQPVPTELISALNFISEQKFAPAETIYLSGVGSLESHRMLP